ncbi:hypothetical protein [Methylobacterium mesophilicum]
MVRSLSVLLILVASASVAPAAPAERPAYVGIWARDAKACKLDPNKVESPFIKITYKQVEGGEWICDITRKKITGSNWVLSASCSGEGDNFKETFSSADFVRCAEKDWRGTGM